MSLKPGDSIPLYLAVDNQSNDYLVSAKVVQTSPDYEEISSESFLSNIEYSEGEYINTSLTVPSGAKRIVATYYVYDDSSEPYVLLATAQDVWDINEISQASNDLLVGIIEDVAITS